MKYPSPKLVVAAAGLVAAISTITAFARPIFQTDPLPLAGQGRVQQLAQNFEQMQNTQQKLLDRLDDATRRADLIELEVWANELDRAEQDLKRNPNSSSALRYRNEVKDRVNQVRARLGLPLLPQ